MFLAIGAFTIAFCEYRKVKKNKGRLIVYITFGPLIEWLGNIMYGALFERSAPKESEIAIPCLKNGQTTAKFSKSSDRRGMCVKIIVGENEIKHIEVHAGMFVDLLSWNNILDQRGQMSIIRFVDPESGEEKNQLTFYTRLNKKDASEIEVWVSICAPINSNKWSKYTPILSSQAVEFSACLLTGRPKELKIKYRKLARRIYRL
ncbi:MAG: hypothetical protein ACHP6H_02240 [Legionellales bacterium]